MFRIFYFMLNYCFSVFYSLNMNLYLVFKKLIFMIFIVKNVLENYGITKK